MTTTTLSAPKFEATDTTDNGTPAAAFRIDRTLGTGFNASAHGFRDQTVFNRAAGNAYNAFDAAYTISGSTNTDHSIGFQARGIYNSTGRISDFYGGGTLMSATAAGNITRAYGWDVFNITNSGGAVIDTFFGYRTQSLTAGTKNYAFASEGTTPSYMLGKLAIGKRDATYPLHVYSSTLASTSEDNLLYVEGDAGRGSFAVTNWGTVYVSQSDGAGGILGNIYMAEPNARIGISYAPTSGIRFDNGVDTTGTDAYYIARKIGGLPDFYYKVYTGDFTAIGNDAATLTTPVSSAVLNVASSSKGLLIPRMTRTAITSISTPATGLLVYSSDLLKLYQYNSLAWTPFVDSTTASTSFIRNQTTQQSSSNFNISGAGVVGGDMSAAGNFIGTGSSSNIRYGQSGYIYCNNRFIIRSPSDGILTISNNAETGLTAINLGTATSASPSLRVIGANLGIMDGSGGTGSRLGIGTTSPTAVLHLKAGTTAASTAPLKFTTQAAALTTPEQGTMELVGNSLQFTQLVKRRGVAMTQAVILADIVADNTATETAALITAEHGANYLEVGKSEKITLVGMTSQRNNAASYLKMYIKYGGVTIDSVATPGTQAIAAGSPFELSIYMTIRTVGATGTMQINSIFTVDGIAVIPSAPHLITINTTTAQNTTVTAKWNEANASNLFTLNQGHILCIEPNR
jgi:hypothetical protein